MKLYKGYDDRNKSELVWWRLYEIYFNKKLESLNKEEYCCENDYTNSFEGYEI